MILVGKSLRWGTPRGLCAADNPAQVLKQPGGMVSLYCPLRCFSASFPPSFLHAWSSKHLLGSLLVTFRWGVLFVLLLTSVFFSWSLYWQSFSTFLLSLLVECSNFYVFSDSYRGASLIACQAGCWKPLFGFAEGGGIAHVYDFCLPTNCGLFSEHTPIYGFCIFICVCR